MDIQKENKQIQEAFEIEADEIGFCLDQKWGDYENPYENSDTALAFDLFKKGWRAKAQVVPEGFVLVEKDLVQSIHRSCVNSLIAESMPAFKIVANTIIDELSPLVKVIQTEAQEPTNDK